MDYQVGNPNAIYLLILVFAVILAAVWASISRRAARRAFATAEQRENLLDQGRGSGFQTLLSLMAIVFLTIAMLDIRWGKSDQQVQQQGLEIVFALDVSRSMLAEDATPNRLSRAKQQIKDMVREMAGDRIGLVAFAGEAKCVTPLTQHYEDFIANLEAVGTDSVDLGGSQLGVALQVSADTFLDKTNGHKTIVLFTDGEDHESKPVEVAQALYQDLGIRVFTIGLGDQDRGAKIPQTRQSRRGGSPTFVTHQGETVESKLNGKILKQISQATGATFIPAGTKQVNMADFYYRFVANVDQESFGIATIQAYTPRYQWFALIALALLVLETLWSSRRLPATSSSQSNSESEKTSAASAKRSITVPLPLGSKLLLLALATVAGLSLLEDNLAGATLISANWQATLPADESSQRTRPSDPETLVLTGSSVATLINRANRQIEQGELATATTLLQQIDDQLSGELIDQRDYNLGVAYFKQGQWEEAESLFFQTSRSKNRELAARSRYNLGNTLCAQAEALLQPAASSPQIEEDASPSPGEVATRKLTRAIESYRSSLRLDPNQRDARANIEIAFQRLQSLKQENQDNQNQENQENQEGQNQEGQNQEGQNQEGQNQEGQNQERQNQERQNQDGQSSDTPSSKNQAAESNPSSGQSSGDRPERDSDDRSEPTDQPIDGELKPIDPDDESSSPAEPEGRETAKPFRMTREEALKQLQGVRDRALRRTLTQQRRERFERSRRQRIPVEKDW